MSGAAGRPPARALSRRALLVAAAGLAAGLAGCGGEPVRRWAGRSLAVVAIGGVLRLGGVTTGGALRQALYEAAYAPFARATGCRVQDFALPIGDILRESRRQSLVGQVQWDALVLPAPHAALAARATPGIFAAEPLPVATDGLVLAYRTGPLRGQVPASWADVWSGDLPGLRLLPEDPVGLLEVALLADGVAPDALYPLDLDRAFAALDRLPEGTVAWWQPAGQPGEQLTLGAADLALLPAGEARAAIAGGAVATVAPLPSPSFPLAICLPARAPNRDVARDFATALQGEPIQAALRDASYGQPAASPDSLPLDIAWWHEEGVAALARFERWRASRV